MSSASWTDSRRFGQNTLLNIAASRISAIAASGVASGLDEVQFAGERELAIRNSDRESRLLQSIRSALARMEDGSYGVCLQCDTQINPKRLSAVPWAAYCVRCQEEADRHGFESDTADSRHELLAV
jgi:DnaK suppressor protein